MEHNTSSNKYYLFGCEIFRDDMLNLIEEIHDLHVDSGYRPQDILNQHGLGNLIPDDAETLTWPETIYFVIKYKTRNIDADSRLKELDDFPF